MSRKMSSCSIHVVGVMLGRTLVFTIYFRSQICAFLSSSARQAPLILVRRHPLVRPPVTTAMVVFHARRVASTRQGVCHFGPRVMASLYFFLPTCCVRLHPVDHGERLVEGSFRRRYVIYMCCLR
jgi:hypothetical protein